MFDTERKESRLDSHNLLSLTVLGEEGETIEQGAARTVNVSEHGLRLETPLQLEAGQSVLITLGLIDDVVEVRGRVVHAEPAEQELCAAGVEFAAASARDQERLHYFLRAYAAGRQ